MADSRVYTTEQEVFTGYASLKLREYMISKESLMEMLKENGGEEFYSGLHSVHAEFEKLAQSIIWLDVRQKSSKQFEVLKNMLQLLCVKFIEKVSFDVAAEAVLSESLVELLIACKQYPEAMSVLQGIRYGPMFQSFPDAFRNEVAELETAAYVGITLASTMTASPIESDTPYHAQGTWRHLES